MVQAAISVGCDSLTIEVHPHPKRGLSDEPQSLRPREFAKLMQDVGVLSQVFGRSQPSEFANATMKQFTLPTMVSVSKTIRVVWK